MVIDADKYVEGMKAEAKQRGSSERYVNGRYVTLVVKPKHLWRIDNRFGSQAKVKELIEQLNEERGHG